MTPKGYVNASELFYIEDGAGPTRIDRKRKMRRVDVSMNLLPGHTTGEIMGKIGKLTAEMKDQVPDKIKSERSEKLIRLDETKSEVFRRSFLDKESEIIPEDIITFGGKKYLRGYNKSYVRFMVPLTNDEEGTGKIGQIIRVQGQELCETCVLALIL
jgi:hypothetical protein